MKNTNTRLNEMTTELTIQQSINALLSINVYPTVRTFHCGHLVDAEILSWDVMKEQYNCRFLRHTTTRQTRLCLDYGQNWYTSTGDMFTTGTQQIRAAADCAAVR